MPELSRRQYLKQLGALAGTAAMSSLSAPAFAADTEIPPQGIGKGIKHISYSDIGGRPDSVQVMVNRKHVYVGHMFSDGVTILDASRSAQPEAASGFFTAGQYTRTHHLQVADDLLLLANGANIVAMQSYDNMRGYFENNARRQHHQPQEIPLRPVDPRHLQARRDARDRVPRNARLRHQPPVVAGRALRLCRRRTSTASPTTSCASSTCKNITKPEIVSKWWLPGMNRAAGEPRPARRASATRCIT